MDNQNFNVFIERKLLMSKILALDIGDQWTGVALSDNLRFFAKPYKTIATAELEQFLVDAIKKESIEIIVIGYPKTMSGRESDQTRKTVAYKQKLEQIMSQIQFVLWDERLSSKRAQTIKKVKTKEDKLALHARAAAFILDSYLLFLSSTNNNLSNS